MELGESIYFYIQYPKKQRENEDESDIVFVVPENEDLQPKCIYREELPKTNFYFYKKIYKVSKAAGKGNNYKFEYVINDEKYEILFDAKEYNFIYDVNLKFGKKIIDFRTKINQNKQYYQTIEYFIKAFDKEKEKERLINDLFKEAIKLYSKKYSFIFLIELFIKMNDFGKNDLCSDLLEIFKEMNGNPKDNAKNMDRPDNLGHYTSKFKTITAEADKYLKDKEENFIDVYGLILSYLNYYDYEYFSKMINDLSKNNRNNLYDILLIYNMHFFNQINQSLKFFNDFIIFSIDKDLKGTKVNEKISSKSGNTPGDSRCLEKALNYIKDIETFLRIVDDNKEIIFKKYNGKKIIKLDNLQFRKSDADNREEIVLSNISKKYNEENLEENIKNRNKSIFDVLNNIRSIIKFCNKNSTFIIYLTNNFWQYVLNYYNEVKDDNIVICYNLRNIFMDYHDCVMKIFEKKDAKFSIKSDANIYFQRDEFAIILDQIIKKYNNNPENNMTNMDKLGFITKYNPYYKEPNYSNKVDCEIFDQFDLNNCNQFSQFKSMNFEKIFMNNITDYIKKFMEKIKNISDFNVVINLININNIDKNEYKSFYLNLINTKYDEVISNEIGLLSDTKLKEAIHLVACLAIINYIYGIDKGKFTFINERIKKLDDKENTIISSIFNEIANICFIKDGDKDNYEYEENEGDDEFENKILERDFKNNDFGEMKKYLFDEFSSNIEKEKNIDNIIEFIDCLKEIDKRNKEEEKMENEFVYDLITKNMFNKEEFFSRKDNKKILLLYNLYKKGKVDLEIIKQNYQPILDDINKDIKGNIIKSKLEAFLNNDKSLVLYRLELIKIIVPSLIPNDKYDELKNQNDEMNKRINELKEIKDNIIIYYKELYQDIIINIKNLIDTNQNQKIDLFKKGGKFGEIKDTDIEKLKIKTKKIKKVKHLLLFNVIYDLSEKRDENIRFEESFDKLDTIGISLKELNDLNDNGNIDNIIAEGLNKLNKEYNDSFNQIKKKLCNNKEDAEKFKNDIIKFYELSNSNLIKKLDIFFNSKKYELDIKSIIFFFNCHFQKDDWNEKLLQNDFEKGWEKDFKNIQNDLDKLNTNQIYDYTNIKYYNKLFTCLYEEEEAIDFLFNRTSDDILKLKDKIQPTDTTINIKDLLDTENCVNIINQLKEIKANKKKFDFITTLSNKIINQFENYSKIYSSVIELYTDDDEFSDNIYLNVVKIIEDATFNILQDNEKFLYNKDKDISMKDLIHLKNQIHLRNDAGNNEDDIIKSKCKILLFFKDVITKLEVIIAYMNVLRRKGCSLPILISIKIKIIKQNEKEEIPIIEYYLDKYKKEFEEIREFLFDVKNAYILQLNSIYKEKLNLRFLYGKQLRIIMKHIEHNYKIDSFLRYILNNTDNNNLIKEGDKYIERNVYNYIDNKQYELYSRNSLDGISNYITSLFEKNNKTIERHYEDITIRIQGYKGIYIQECAKNTKEKLIIDLFIEKTNKLPIGQNVLITNKETSSEEIQCFFHRAILCNYNTLFVVEMNDSLSDFQQSRMNAYIDSLLTYKNNEYNDYNKDKNEKIDKTDTQKYLESCIVFIYDNENKNIIPFIKEIEKFKSKNEKEGGRNESIIISNNSEKLNKLYYNNYDSSYDNNNYLKNILVMTSDICGLGKTEEIKNKIKNKKYFHFPLGGSLTKSKIFDKLDNLLSDITNEIKKNKLKYKDTAIHLDLTESKETSIINEFFFSFLITRFYTNNENIIYIPKDINIYIEIPNCFDDFLSKYSILTIFKRQNITLDDKPKSDNEIVIPSFDYQENVTKHFKNMLNIISDKGNKEVNKELEKFVKEYIGGDDKKSRYSFHQINIFVKLFISQYSQYNVKIKFLDINRNIITGDVISKFAECTKYFTNGAFSKLLTDSQKGKKNKKKKKKKKKKKNKSL